MESICKGFYRFGSVNVRWSCLLMNEDTKYEVVCCQRCFKRSNVPRSLLSFAFENLVRSIFGIGGGGGGAASAKYVSGKILMVDEAQTGYHAHARSTSLPLSLHLFCCLSLGLSITLSPSLTPLATYVCLWILYPFTKRICLYIYILHVHRVYPSFICVFAY